jgi:hypothetical protein
MSVGYNDTPILPDSEWHVHDGDRPQPAIVTPGTQESLGGAPSDAVVLFDGADTSKWVGRDGEVQWKVEDGYMEVTRTGDIKTKDSFGNCQLHIEWASPSEVKGESQGRGNSGVFLMDRYEIQVLDGYDNITYADGITAAIYGQYPPLVNACRKPGEWQTYDIIFIGPRFDENELIQPAYATIIHNGVLVHHHQAVLGPTGHRSLSSYSQPHPPEAPLRLQDHGDLVRYRNIWIRPI